MALALARPGGLRAEEFDYTETWSAPGLAGWAGGTSQATLANAAGYLDVRFKSQTVPAASECVAYYAFTNAIEVSNLSLKFFASEGPPSNMRFCLGSRDGQTWFVSQAGVPAGKWVMFDVPAVFSAGWKFRPGSTEAEFEQARTNVQWVGVYVRRDATAAAVSYGIDDFHIQSAESYGSLALSGHVWYDGPQGGPIRVLAVSAGGPIGMSAGTTLPAPGQYQIAGLARASDYWVIAYRDSNGNAVWDSWEAVGVVEDLVHVLFSDVGDVNLWLEDPTSADGLPYWWLKQYFGLTLERNPKIAGYYLADQDSDDDGMSNYAEYRAGTDPTDWRSVLEAEIEAVPDVPGVTIRWSSVLNRIYSVMSGTSVTGDFDVLDTYIPATPPVNVYDDTTATNAAVRFYRIRLDSP